MSTHARAFFALRGSSARVACFILAAMLLSLVFHNHQPIGQLPWAFEDAWRDSYSPFLDVLEAHPKVRVALHYTGPLLDWLQEHKPETIARVRNLVEREQVEILAGGFYEPILAIWPESDRLAQIARLRDRVELLFGRAPRGLWLAERVWEPDLARSIRASGIDYTFVDGTVFQAAGVDEASSFRSYAVTTTPVTKMPGAAATGVAHEYSCGGDAEGDALAVFPINLPLRYRIPWKPVADSIGYFREVAQHDPNALVVFADDGEKFGGWPGTFDWVFTQGWLDSFFTALEENAAWLQTVTPADALNRQTTLPKIQLPSGSYAEMQSWAGGDWRNFLARYQESGDIRDEIMRARAQLEAAAAMQEANAASAVSAMQIERAREHILRAQSNDAFWHGVFGGLYLRHLRQALYAEATAAQALLQGDAPFANIETSLEPAANQEEAAQAPRVEAAREIFLRNETQKIGARANGGHLFLWTSVTARHNILSTLRRYRETYHDVHSPVDWHPRGALLDHFLGEDATPELFARNHCAEEGDFISERWQLQTRANGSANEPQEGAQKVSITARRQGHVWSRGVHRVLDIEKIVSLRAGSPDVEVEYRFFNPSDDALDVWWGSEWNVALSGADLPERHYHADDHKARLDLNRVASFESVANPIVADTWLGLWVEWHFDQPTAMWHVPIETVSQKEGGAIERTHQSSAFVFHRRLHLAPRHEYSCAFKATISVRAR